MIMKKFYGVAYVRRLSGKIGGDEIFRERDEKKNLLQNQNVYPSGRDFNLSPPC